MKRKSKVFVMLLTRCISSSAVSWGYVSPVSQTLRTYHAIFSLQSFSVSPPLCYIFYSSKPISASWIRDYRVWIQVPHGGFFDYFYWFWNIWLVRLIGYKAGINAIQPEGGAYLAGEVIDLLQDLGLPPPQSRKRLIFPPQMENKLPFKHVKSGENDWKSTGRVKETVGEEVRWGVSSI